MAFAAGPRNWSSPLALTTGPRVWSLHDCLRPWPYALAAVTDPGPKALALGLGLWPYQLTLARPNLWLLRCQLTRMSSLRKVHADLCIGPISSGLLVRVGLAQGPCCSSL